MRHSALIRFGPCFGFACRHGAALCAFAISLLHGPPARGLPIGPQPASAPVELRAASPPQTTDESEKLLAELDAEIAALVPTTQPATTQPTTQPDATVEQQLDGWRQRLWRNIEDLRTQLTELVRQTKAAELLSRDSEVRALTDKIAAWKRRTAELAAQPIPDWITDEDIAKAESEHDLNNKAAEGLNANIAQRESLLGAGFSAERSRLADELKAAQAPKEQLESSYEIDLKAAGSQSARQLVEVRLRSLAARVAALGMAQATLNLKEKRTQQELERNRLERDALGPYVAALRARLSALIEEKSRGRAERLRARIETSGISEPEKAYLELELLREENIAVLQKKYANEVRDRFQLTALNELQAGAKRDRAFWEAFSSSLSRRSAADVQESYREADRELPRARAEVGRLQRLLDQSITEERTLEHLKDVAISRFDGLDARLRDLTRTTADESKIKRRQQVGQIRLELRSAFDQILAEEREVIERLRAGCATAEQHAALWESAVSRLYWAHLATRGSTIVGLEALKAVGSDAQSLLDGRLSSALRGAAAEMRRQLRGATAMDWLVVVLEAAVVAYAFVRLQRKCARVRDAGLETLSPDAEPSEPPMPAFVMRLRYHLGRIGATHAPILGATILVAAVILALDVQGAPARVGYLLAALLGGTTLAVGILRAAVQAPKPRFRLISCSRTVARYYSRFGYALIGLTVALLAPAFLLKALGLASALPRQLSEWYFFLANILGFIFLLRRDTVLNIFPRNERGRFAGSLTTLRASYPGILLLAALLVLMHLTGFKALAIYISTGLAETVGLLLAAWILYELIGEFILWTARRVRKLRGSYVSSDDDSANLPTDATARSKSPSIPIQDLPAVRSAKSAVRWILTLGLIVIALSCWGVRPYDIKQLLDLQLWSLNEKPLTLWRIGGSVIAIWASVFISRTIRQTLNARVYPLRPSIDRGAQAAINTLLHYLILAIGVYVAFQTLLLDFGALAVLFGGLGLGLGLGLQPLIVNFVSGLLMLFERHVKIGDLVRVHDKLGEVTKVSMRSTTIRTPDGIFLVIPNGDFINQKVENWTLEGTPLRAVIEVGVSYDCKPRDVRDLLLELAAREPRVLRDPSPEVALVEFADNNLKFSLACWFRDPADRGLGSVSLRYAIHERFREAGIEIPYPHRALSFAGGRPLEVKINDARDVKLT